MYTFKSMFDSMADASAPLQGQEAAFSFVDALKRIWAAISNGTGVALHIVGGSEQW
jgi:hypothetical protein